MEFKTGGCLMQNNSSTSLLLFCIKQPSVLKTLKQLRLLMTSGCSMQNTINAELSSHETDKSVIIRGRSRGWRAGRIPPKIA